MMNFPSAIALLSKDERKSALRLAPLIILRGFADMLGVAMIFPFLKILGTPELVDTNPYLSRVYGIGLFSSPESFVIAIGIAFILVLILTAALKVLTVYAVSRWLEERKYSISTRLLTVYLSQPYDFTLGRHSSELATNMLAETARVVSEVFRSISDIMLSVVTIVFMVTMLLVVDPTMTLLAIAVFSIIYAVLYLGVRRAMTRLGATILATNRMCYRVALEALAGGKQVRLLNRERSLLDSYRAAALRFARANATARIVRQVPRFVIELAAIGGIVIVTLVLMVRSGGAGSQGIASMLPVMGVFALALYRMLPAFQSGYAAIVSLRLSGAATEALRADLAHLPRLPALPEGRIEVLRFRESIALRGVGYTYPNASTPSLAKIDLRIPAGSSVGIVGHTGAGKTTLMDLILGLIEPSEGELLIDGKKLDHDQLRSWRANVGYVPQDIFLSDSSIAQNIAFGVPDDEIDEAQVRKAARMAQIEDFILNELPDGFETLVGERGVRLSGGQRQRISIARALYTEPEVIAFDEATSALDNDTESLVMGEIAKLVGQRTLIMVAHRLTTVRDCDMIVTLECGKVKSIGTYADLVKSDETLLSVVAGGR